tara:strand:+ start:3092 stop:4015 length:924 start_codon:yes stop_codon:yes gene_type:complete
MSTESRKINVALCVSGEMRRWSNLYNTILNLSFPFSKKYASKNNTQEFKDIQYNLDVFVHTWDQITYSKRQKTWDLNIREENLEHKDLIEKVQPKKILIEQKSALDPYIDLFKEKYSNFRECPEIDKKVKFTNYTCLSQFYGMRKAHDLRLEYQKEHNITYDFVIRTRSDIEIKEWRKGTINFVLEKLSVFDHREKKHVCNGTTPLLYCPWIYGDHRLHTIMEYALMLGRPNTFDVFFENFPECLDSPAGFGNTSHGVMYNHIHGQHVYIRAPIPLVYTLDHNPSEMAEQPSEEDGEFYENTVPIKK